MIEIGRVCIKIAGRNAGKHCVVVDKIDDNFVLIDGNVKRKKCNVRHLEPLDMVLKIKKGDSTSSVHDAMKGAKFKVFTTKPKAKKAERPKKQKKQKVKKETKPETKKKPVKKESKKK